MVIIFFLTALCVYADLIHVNAKINNDYISHVDFYFYESKKNKTHTDVICLFPGSNQNSKLLITDEHWSLLKKNNLFGICSVSFFSPAEYLTIDNQKGYFYKSSGSFEIFNKLLQRFYPNHKSLYLYGYSGGAHFATNYTRSYPNKVRCFSAYSARWWINSDIEQCSNAIIACGNKDISRYHPSLNFFLEGRRANLPWTWVELDNTGHERSLKLELFTINYFNCLRNEDTTPVHYNFLRSDSSPDGIFTSVLPSEKLLGNYIELITKY